MANGLFSRNAQVMGPQQAMADVGRGLARMAEPALGMMGMQSEEQAVLSIMEGVDPTNLNSVKQGFRDILQISPPAAIEFRKQMMPFIQSQQQQLGKKTGVIDADKFAKAQRYNELVAQYGPSEGTKKYLSERAADKVQMTGTIPTGYRMTPAGTLEPIPGSPAQAEQEQVEKAAEARKTLAKRGINVVKGKIKDAANLMNLTREDTVDPLFGISGAGASYVPGTQRKDMENIVETIKANIGFDKLQQMREASPTGGALGQVAVQELVALQASLGSLSLDQSREEFTRSLNNIDKHYNNMLMIIDGKMPKGIDKQQNLNPLGI